MIPAGSAPYLTEPGTPGTPGTAPRKSARRFETSDRHLSPVSPRTGDRNRGHLEGAR
jgi:hypothetical protein